MAIKTSENKVVIPKQPENNLLQITASPLVRIVDTLSSAVTALGKKIGDGMDKQNERGRESWYIEDTSLLEK